MVDPTYRKKDPKASSADAKEEAVPPINVSELKENIKLPLRGQVEGFRERSENEGAWTVWNFRLERFDSKGNRLPPIPVEMISDSFSGFIQDGDKVELYGDWGEGGVFQCGKLLNRTMKDSWVEAKHSDAIRGVKQFQSILIKSKVFKLFMFGLFVLFCIVFISVVIPTFRT